MTRALSQRQKLILEFIQRHIDRQGYPPTVREIGDAVKLSSSSTVHAHLKSLEERGYIQREAVLTRAIKIVSRATGSVAARAGEIVRQVQSVPILGTVAAGKPLLATEDIEDYFPLPTDFISGDGFILHVKGDSMIEDGIRHGDYVVVRRQANAENGETVVALIEGEATVKRFYKEPTCVRLQPANSAMQPFYVENAEILGKVVGVIRKLS